MSFLQIFLVLSCFFQNFLGFNLKTSIISTNVQPAKPHPHHPHLPPRGLFRPILSDMLPTAGAKIICVRLKTSTGGSLGSVERSVEGKVKKRWKRSKMVRFFEGKELFKRDVGHFPLFFGTHFHLPETVGHRSAIDRSKNSTGKSHRFSL